jgi:hypothetical protein
VDRSIDAIKQTPAGSLMDSGCLEVLCMLFQSHAPDSWAFFFWLCNLGLIQQFYECRHSSCSSFSNIGCVLKLQWLMANWDMRKVHPMMQFMLELPLQVLEKLFQNPKLQQPHLSSSFVILTVTTLLFLIHSDLRTLECYVLGVCFCNSIA